MRIIYHFLTLLLVTISFAQTGKIEMKYDASGNQIYRIYIHVSDKQSNTYSNIKKEILNSDLITSDIYDDIKYYPNPVREELYLNWKVENSNVTDIEIYSINGQLIKSLPNLKTLDRTTINFQDYPQGYYNLVLVYTNGDKKTLKIIKN